MAKRKEKKETERS